MSRFVPLPYYYAIPDWVLTPTGGAGALYDIGLGEVVTTFGGAESLFELDLEVLAREPISVGFPGLGFIEFQLFAGLTDAEAGFAFGFAWRHDGDQVVEATIPLAIVLTTPLLTPAILTDEGPEPDPSTDAVSIQLTTNVSWVSS
ncbi:MAG TPA: hypothetical protein ENK57_02245, partial [Polyangiaceae bacterium]|nr:hypothetical protein [Polyangiaceae bacterium]